ncbi:hypothetical protein T10_12912 [Trichinella papuae]|uniref:Uncharacterized protein n=1 Tax=Trichinella papuae TaxID=268474 RepID=A0A0V1MB29_9BILA|nr:hypothetical protein T10_12912 [Trichinella papuae]
MMMRMMMMVVFTNTIPHSCHCRSSVAEAFSFILLHSVLLPLFIYETCISEILITGVVAFCLLNRLQDIFRIVH